MSALRAPGTCLHHVLAQRAQYRTVIGVRKYGPRADRGRLRQPRIRIDVPPFKVV